MRNFLLRFMLCIIELSTKKNLNKSISKRKELLKLKFKNINLDLKPTTEQLNKTNVIYLVMNYWKTIRMKQNILA